jgi:hypothetical protein
MARSKSSSFFFEIPVFKSGVVCVVGDIIPARKLILKYLPSNVLAEFENDITDNTRGMIERSTKNIILFWLRYPPKDPESYGFLTHESVHAALGIMNHKGIVMSWDTEEVLTYLSQYITEQILKRV